MPETADAWIAAWEAHATQDGLERGAAYWEAGWEGSASSEETRAAMRMAAPLLSW